MFLVQKMVDDLSNLSLEAQNNSNKFTNLDYKSLQLKYFCYVLIFWTSFAFFLINPLQLKQIINFLFFPFYLLIDFLLKKKLKSILEYFYFLNIIQSLTIYRVIITRFANLIQYLLQTKDTNTTATEIYRNLNIFTKLNNFFRNLIMLVSNIKRSLSLVKSIFSLNILWIITLPLRAAMTLKTLSYEMRKFWKTIEQIIQIVRLPIEILLLIGKFLSSVGNLLRRINRPRIQIVLCLLFQNCIFVYSCYSSSFQ